MCVILQLQLLMQPPKVLLVLKQALPQLVIQTMGSWEKPLSISKLLKSGHFSWYRIIINHQCLRSTQMLQTAARVFEQTFPLQKCRKYQFHAQLCPCSNLTPMCGRSSVCPGSFRCLKVPVFCSRFCMCRCCAAKASVSVRSWDLQTSSDFGS